MSTAIEFNNISKLYRLGLVSSGTLSNDLKRWWQMSVLGKEDPFLKVGSVNDRSTAADSDYVWALKDINFKVEQGDVMGIIGKNGAGKSTLLKLLSKVTGPTTGTIKAKGRIGSLLEVGTGFHSELTGRENIYMNGAILGMSKQEINSKIDAIIDFSGCERYIDTPVKRYSSGMTVRLGFAVAAHLDPEILVVDEVLAVGDAEFQKKAIGKMQDVSKGEGRTVLFVSHNMASIRQLCISGVILDKGSVKMMGTADECVNEYIGSNLSVLCSYADITDAHRNYEYTSRDIEFLSAKMLGDVNEIASNQPLEFEVKMRKNRAVDKFTFEVMLNNQSDVRVGCYISDYIDISKVKIGNEFVCRTVIEHHDLAKGKYGVGFNIGLKDIHVGLKDYDVIHNVLAFSVTYADAVKKDVFAFWPSYNGSIYFKGQSELV